jgi:hypothetical protein
MIDKKLYSSLIELEEMAKTIQTSESATPEDLRLCAVIMIVAGSAKDVNGGNDRTLKVLHGGCCQIARRRLERATIDVN